MKRLAAYSSGLAITDSNIESDIQTNPLDLSKTPEQINTFLDTTVCWDVK